jgi:hypothetical protein
MRFFRGRSRASLSIAAFIAIPLFFASLMASTLALEKPLKFEWQGGKNGILTTWHDPTTATVTSIWLWALLPALVLVLVGTVSMRIPLGFYITCAAGVAIAMAVAHKTATWEAHHTARYPNGVDLIPSGSASAASNKYDRGEWEHMARETALSLQHWTIGVALASALVMASLYVRRRFFARNPVQAYGPLEGIHAPDATPPGLGDHAV